MTAPHRGGDKSTVTPEPTPELTFKPTSEPRRCGAGGNHVFDWALYRLLRASWRADINTKVDARNSMVVRQCVTGGALRVKSFSLFAFADKGPGELSRRKPLGCWACECKRAGAQPPGSVPGTRPSSGAQGDLNSTGAAATRRRAPYERCGSR